MLTIAAHGVQNAPNSSLSLAQDQLWHAAQPIRILNAPTGSGKTYAFLEMARAGQLIFFIVPTVALANDIEAAALKKAIPVSVWNSEQTQAAKAEGDKVWLWRQEWFTQTKEAGQGGMVVITLETFVQFCFGAQNLQHMKFGLIDLLQYVDHIVFDEMHTLNERAVGFVTLWMVVVAAFFASGKKRYPRLNLLSATLSNLPEIAKALLVDDHYFVYLEENLSAPLPDRYLHGDVILDWQEEENFLTVIQQALPSLLAEYGNRCLIIFDSLKTLADYEMPLCRFFLEHHIQPHEVFIINSQDRHSTVSLGGASFTAGRRPEAHHRVILGTSSIEMGVNYEVRAAIMQPGLDAASFFQRVGRIARGGNITGKIVLPRMPRELAALTRLQQKTGDYHIEALIQEVSQGQALRQLSVTRAIGLAYAYWSMLKREAQRSPDAKVLTHLLEAALVCLDKVHKTSTLDKIHEKKDLWKTALKPLNFYLEQIDMVLKDVRGFNPTVLVQFKGSNSPIFSMDAYWFMRFVDPSAYYYDEKTKVHIFQQTRSESLSQISQKIEIHALLPKGPQMIQGLTPESVEKNYQRAFESTLTFCPALLKKLLLDFYRETGLIPKQPAALSQFASNQNGLVR